MLNRIIIILAIIAATIGYSVYQKKSLENNLASSNTEAILAKLPQGLFETLDGKPYDPHSLFQNERVGLLLVHYWGTWCAPCEAELPELLTLVKRFEGRSDVKFLLVAVDDEKMKIEKHLKTLVSPSNVTWLIDNKKVHRDIYGTTRVPETYLFSSDKVTLKKYIGPQQWGKPMFSQSFDEFIQISTNKL